MKNRIREEITFSSKEKAPRLVRLPTKLQEIVLNAKKENINIHAIRIIVRILSKIKFRQIRSQEQLDLFNETYFEQGDSLVQMTFDYNDFLPDNYTSIEPVKDALKFLENYGNKEHKFKNKKGHELLIKGGLLLGGYTFNMELKTVTIYMNAYWYYLFLDIVTHHFNEHLFYLFFKTQKINTLILYSYLTTLPEKGTKASLDTLNAKFGTKYDRFSEMDRSLLKSIKLELDKDADISFNYSKDLSNKRNVHIVPYYTNNETKKLNLKDLEYGRIKRKVAYLKKKHGLTNTQAELIKSAFKSQGFDKMNYLVSKNKKTWTKNLTGEDFVNVFRTHYSNFIKHFEKNKSTKEF